MTPETLSDPALVRAWAIEQAVARRDSSDDLISRADEMASFVLGPEADCEKYHARLLLWPLEIPVPYFSGEIGSRRVVR